MYKPEKSHKIRKTIIFLLVVFVLYAAFMLLETYKFFPSRQPYTYWKVYSNPARGIQFQYPAELNFREDGSKIVLWHQLKYKNKGDCDMMGDEKIYDYLTDFQMVLEIVGPKEKPNVTDGEFSAGILKGPYEYYGAEGCGDTNYYFPLNGDKQLLVRRANIQTLSGIRSNLEEREEILLIPGAISKETNDKLFRKILSTFKIIGYGSR